jgi:hypothetical protein
MISMKIIQNAHEYNTRFEEPSVTHAENRKDNLDCYLSTHGIFFSQRQSWYEIVAFSLRPSIGKEP